MNKKFTKLELLAIVLVTVVIATILISKFRTQKRIGRSVTCKSNLKQIGTSVAVYYSDSNEMTVPLKQLRLVNATDFDGDTIDSSITKCPTNYLNYVEDRYIWLIGKKYSGSEKSPLATDFGIHQSAPQKFLVFQDGHVAKMTFKIYLNALRERAGIPIFSNPN